jgi:hypothetical protein
MVETKKSQARAPQGARATAAEALELPDELSGPLGELLDAHQHATSTRNKKAKMTEARASAEADLQTATTASAEADAALAEKRQAFERVVAEFFKPPEGGG